MTIVSLSQPGSQLVTIERRALDESKGVSIQILNPCPNSLGRFKLKTSPSVNSMQIRYVVTLVMKMPSSCSRPPWAVLRAALWCIFVMSGASVGLISQTSDNPSGNERKTIEENLDLLPLRFEPNQGQSSSDTKFLAQGRGFSALFKENEADFRLAGHSLTSGLLRVTLLNASSNAAVSGEKRLPGTVNYFIGSDREKWHTGLPTFASLRYTNVYPGTDLIYYGSRGNLEFDFQLSPGADPSQIQMRFEGVQSLGIDCEGDLIVTANDGHISFQKPVIYQPEEDGRKDLVAGSFKILEKNKVGFVLARYDRTRPLIIDPILNYSTYIGGYAEATSIAVDQSGEAYVAGWTELNFPTAPGSFQSGSQCSADNTCAFVAKFNSTGTALLYSAILGGSAHDTANGIVLDASGDAFVVGGTNSIDFPVTTGAFQTKNKQTIATDNYRLTGFVTELNSTGSSLLYSTYLGGSTSAAVNQVAIDASGNAYLTGTTQDTDFPTTPGAYRTNAVTKASGYYNSAFIAKLNPAGTALVYSTYLGGSQWDTGLAIAVDSAGEAYVGGSTNSSDFPVTPGAIQSAREASNRQAGFVTRLNASGSALVYSTYLGGNVLDNLNAIAVNSKGNAYATGSTNSADFPITAGAFQSKLGTSSFDYPQQNAFVSELNSTGTALLYSSFLGGGISLGANAGLGDQANAISVDAQGMVYLTGMACTGDFPVTAGAFEAQNLDGETSGECTAFLTKMNPAPNTPLIYSTFIGGTGNEDNYDWPYGEEGNGLAIDPSGNIFIAGLTYSVDFPATSGVIKTAFDGQSEKAFVTEFNGSEMKTLPIPTVTLTSSTSSALFGQPVTFTATVQPASGSSTPTGFVGFNFFDAEPSDSYGAGVGFGPWTEVALDGAGVATFSTSSLEQPQTKVNAFYLGDTNNAPARGTMTQAVTDLATTTTVTASANNVPYGTSITFTVTVVDQNGKPAQGTVQVGNGYLGSSLSLNSNGQGTWTESFLPVGTNIVFANFLPDPGYIKSRGTVNVTITPLGVTPDPTLTPPAGTYGQGQRVTFGDSNPAAVVYYTTDGTTPVPGVSPNLSPVGFSISINASETINAVALAPGYSPSNMVSDAYTISLSPPPGFTTGIGATTSLTVTRGSTSGNTGTVSVMSTNGFSGAVQLTCSVTTAMTAVNDMPTCSLNPVSVSISTTVGQTSTLTVNTTAASSAENKKRDLFGVLPGATSLALALFFGGFKRRRARWAILVLLVLLVSVGMTACGSGGGSGNGGGGSANPGTTLGTYTITVRGASAGVSSTVGTVALTVQ